MLDMMSIVFVYDFLQLEYLLLERNKIIGLIGLRFIDFWLLQMFQKNISFLPIKLGQILQYLLSCLSLFREQSIQYYDFYCHPEPPFEKATENSVCVLY